MAIDNPYNMMPPLSPEEYASLMEAVRTYGARLPIFKDEVGINLDGENREKIYRELGITDYPVEVCTGLTEDQKVELSLQLNLARRHLDRDTLQSVALRLRQRRWSFERIAKALGVGTTTAHRWLDDVSQTENVTTPAVITDTKGRLQPARKPRTPQAKKVTKPDARETTSPAAEDSPPPPPQPVSTNSHVHLNEHASDASIEPSQAPAELPVPQAADDHGKRVRVQIERLYRRLRQQQAQGTLRALTDAWPTTQKEYYRRRCTALIGALEALRDALSAAEIAGEDGDGVAAMASAHDDGPSLQEVTL